jgi:hypothetical protein
MISEKSIEDKSKEIRSESKKDQNIQVKRLAKIEADSRDNKEIKKQKIEELDREINELKEKNLNVEELDIIIKKLHDYNEIKDLSLTLLDKVANFKCLPIKEVFKMYEINEND